MLPSSAGVWNLISADDALEEPSVGALLAACERGLAQGNTGVDAALCEWYTVPCDCKLTRADTDLQSWCLPETESIDSAMLAVIGKLRQLPDTDRSARQIVPDILARLYPCSP
ncbi:MAG: hypothetical protein N838_13510 [Thiohalocapsa sp. PB-PSB1]|nr:MAG: hypothetical protein N838_13510 [Thiohalocapsa sp. PB-PSB1]